MFDITLSGGIIEVQINMPLGKTNEQLLNIARVEIEKVISNFYGKEVHINSRLSTHLAMYLGYRLAHICKSVWLFDPKDNNYYQVVSH